MAHEFSPDQQVAYDGIGQWLEDPHAPQTAGLTGYAGCGKTTVVTRLAYDIKGIRYCAPTAQAASVLNRTLPDGNRATTAHRLLRNYGEPEDLLCQGCSAVVDEWPEDGNCKESKLPLDPKIEQAWNYWTKSREEFADL